MYLFFADEADQGKNHDGGFFIYGGAASEASRLAELNERIDKALVI